MSGLIPIYPLSQLPASITRRTEIVASTLESIEQREIIEFFRTYPDYFLACFYRYVNFSSNVLGRFQDRLDWDKLSGNDHVCRGAQLSENLLEEYFDNWNWKYLGIRYPVQVSVEFWEAHEAELIKNFSLQIYGLGRLADLLTWTEKFFVDQIDSLNFDLILRGLDILDRRGTKFSTHLINFLIQGIDKKVEHLAPDSDFMDCQEFESRISKFSIDPWTIDFIEIHKERWFWPHLSVNPSLPWSEELIVCFETKWSWHDLSHNPNIPWSEDLIARFENRWDWDGLSSSKTIPWSVELIERFEDKWNWQKLCWNQCIPFTVNMLQANRERVDWYGLSLNEGKFWNFELIDTLFEYLNFHVLSNNESLPWSEHLINHFIHKWTRAILINPAVPNKDKFISQVLKHGLSVGCFSDSTSITWTKELISSEREKLNFGLLSQNHSLPWSIELIDAFLNDWSWKDLSANPSIPWSNELIQRFDNYWDWNELLKNSAVAVTVDMLKKHRRHIGWDTSNRPDLPWDKGILRTLMRNWDWRGVSCNTAMRVDHAFVDQWAEYLHLDVIVDRYSFGIEKLTSAQVDQLLDAHLPSA